MKRSSIASFAFAAILCMAMSGCSYYVYTVDVERRAPSDTGMDLFGKTMSVSFVQKGVIDSLKQSAMADAFALTLEQQYFDGKAAVELFSIKNAEGADYAAKDTLVNLIMSTDVDVAFLLDEPKYTVENGDTTYMMIRLYAYDSTAKIDSVLVFNARKKFSKQLSFNVNSGNQLAKFFDSKWNKESYNIYMYDEEKWRYAVMYADNMEWQKALDLWLEIASSTRSPEKRALASYDAAVACYMLGNYEYATKWLDAAEKENIPIASAQSLRTRIKAAAK